MQPIRIVPDVNVLVSGTTISRGAPSQILQAWRQNYIQIAASPLILEELEKVLQYPKVAKITGLNQVQSEQYVELFRQSAVIVSGTIPVYVSPDPDDNKLFSCAIESQAGFIVSGDKVHVLSVGEYQGIKTISPREFVDTQLVKFFS